MYVCQMVSVRIGLLVDPGFGFGKTLDHNYEILNQLEKFSCLGCRVLSGISRKV